MADVQTTDINTKPTVTAIDSNDQIYISDGGTALKKISYTNLAKAIIEQYNASQLAGATKTIQSAFNELNSKTYSLTLGTRLTGTVDFNTLTTVGNYYCDTAITATNGPVSSLLGITKIEHSVGHDDNYLIQTYYSARNDADIYRRVRHNGNWGAWDKLPNSRTYSLSGGTQLQANVDLDTLLPGNYYAYSTIAVQHGPFSDICGIVKVEHSAGTDDKYLRQTYRRYNNDIIYERIKDGNTWKDWIKLPARAEVDALNSNLTNTLKSGANIIENLIVGGYSTGSGNYFDLFVPLSTSGKDVTAASVSSSTIVFLPAQRVGFSSAPTITVLATTKYGVRLELAFPSTQAANVPGTIYLIGLTLTCS